MSIENTAGPVNNSLTLKQLIEMWSVLTVDHQAMSIQAVQESRAAEDTFLPRLQDSEDFLSLLHPLLPLLFCSQLSLLLFFLCLCTVLLPTLPFFFHLHTVYIHAYLMYT